jgi:hypothetical protein
MNDITPPVPPSPEGPLKPGDIQPPSKQEDSSQQAPEENLKYMGFTFTSKEALDAFRKKFLAQMAKTIVDQIKEQNDRMVRALKKMREEDQ